MKKTILGLLMTVGISSFALANNDERISTTCFTQTVTFYKDTCGNTSEVKIGNRIPVVCEEGQVEGSTSMKIEVVLIEAQKPCSEIEDPVNPK